MSLHALWTRLRTWLRSETGESAVGLVLLVPVILLAGFGLTHDWAGKVRASSEAVTIAQQAARAGANAGAQADVGSAEVSTLNPAQASQAARDYLARTGAEGTVHATATAVTVNVTVSYQPKFLPLGSLEGKGEGTAELHRNDG